MSVLKGRICDTSFLEEEQLPGRFGWLDTKDSLSRLIGESEPVQWMKSFIERVAPLESSVLITGPSGSGKEVVAQIIHALSRRSEKPFARISCASITEENFELMLFGAEKDPSRGIEEELPGKIESAHGGTLLFDEIGDMPLKVQGRLLGFAEHKRIERAGKTDPVPVDVRMLATTNRNLPDLILKGRFREDLFYRLNVMSIQVPPLRDRLEDLPGLVHHLMPHINDQLGTRLSSISNAALNVLTSHDWPGNVRELENMLERAAIMSDGFIIQEPEVRMALRETFGAARSKGVDPDQAKIMNGEGISLKEVVYKLEKRMILQALIKANGKQAEAAEILGLNPKNLWKKIQKHAIKIERSPEVNRALQ
jgi:two-component system, NtrC family, response regulator AtoC